MVSLGLPNVKFILALKLGEERRLLAVRRGRHLQDRQLVRENEKKFRRAPATELPLSS